MNAINWKKLLLPNIPYLSDKRRGRNKGLAF